MLGECHPWITEPVWRGHFEPVLAALEAVLAQVEGTSFAEHNRQRADLDAVVVQLVDPLEDRLRDHPEEVDGRRLRDRLLECYMR